MRLFALLLALLTGLSLAACDTRGAPDAQGRYTLRYASPYPPTHPFSRADIAWMRWVEQRSGGRLHIQPFWGGGLLSSDQSMLEIRHGVADIGLITPIYTRGGAHLQRAQNGFYGGVRTIRGQLAMYDCLQRSFPELRRELEGLHVLAVQGGNLPGVLTRSRQVRSLADLRGLRLRAPTELTGVLERLGADPVNMPMGEVYASLAKGVIDGVVAPTDTFRSLHFSEVARYYATFQISRGGYPARAMTESTYRRLPADLQRVLDDSRAVWEAALEREITGAARTGEAFGRGHGIQFTPISPEDQARFDTVYNEEAMAVGRSLDRAGFPGSAVFQRAHALAPSIDAGGACPAPPPAGAA